MAIVLAAVLTASVFNRRQVELCESHGSDNMDKVGKKFEYTHYFQNNLYLLDL